jgi:hypothetical protein
MRKLLGTFLLAAAASCSVPAHADQPVVSPGSPGSQIAIAIAPAKVRAPYDVQVMREAGEALPTYGHRDRFYVQGNAGERYVIRVTNPTPHRVEAVVSVDGLDVIDGEAGDLRKRGYVIPPYGDVRIEGFRTSSEGVATFRFSSVDGSYAGRKGKARNVGVIAVAIFEEHREAPAVIVAPEPAPSPTYRPPFDDATDAAESYAPGASRRGDRAPAKAAGAPPPAAATGAAGAVARLRPVPPLPAPPPPPPRGGEGSYEDRARMPAEEAPRTERPGLGTEFGEHRYSAASFTRFVRAAGRPVAVAELRYNDAAGLFALGIRAQPLPDAGELTTRETADPFPGDDRFARPPSR